MTLEHDKLCSLFTYFKTNNLSNCSKKEHFLPFFFFSVNDLQIAIQK